MSYSIGFALHSKKARRYLTPTVLKLAEEEDLRITEIDKTTPLESQGPFHLILHKLNAEKDWESELERYAAAHPDVVLVDPLERIRILRSRTTMLSLLPKLKDGSVFAKGAVSVAVPRQIEVGAEMGVEEIERRLGCSGLRYPLLMKPLWAAGGDESHLLGFVRDRKGLVRALNPDFNPMAPPFVAQQIIPHNALMHKVYVIGEDVVCSVRPSLVMSKCVDGFQMLPRISSAVKNGRKDAVMEAPLPEGLAAALAGLLKKHLRLRLFNFDLIEDNQNRHLYYIVDINYFPGIDKIENFEERFVKFLRGACNTLI